MPITERKIEVNDLLECPHDGRAMEKQKIACVLIDRCGSCGGTWFDAEELRGVARGKELEKLAARLPMVRVVSPFRCPRCGHECVEGHVADVEVDTCTQCHGVWLDRGELVEAQRTLKTERLLSAAGSGFRGFLLRM